MDNYYDHATGSWVTDRDRYEAVATAARFATLGEVALSGAPEAAWALMRELLAAIPEDTVHHVGCGVLEDLVHRHPAAIIPRLEAEARADARLWEAAHNMWVARGALPAAWEARLVAALGPGFELLDAPAPDAADRGDESEQGGRR